MRAAKIAWEQYVISGNVETVAGTDDPDLDSGHGDSADDVPVTPSAVTRAALSSRGRSTPASSASRRGPAARERAHAATPQSSRSRRAPAPAPESEAEERDDAGAARRARANEREREQRRPAREERPLRAEYEGEDEDEDEDLRRPQPPLRTGTGRARNPPPPPSPAASKSRETSRRTQDTPRRSAQDTPRRRPAQRSASPVVVHTDSDRDEPPRQKVPSRKATVETDHDSDIEVLGFTMPDWNESVSSPPKAQRRAAPLTRESTQSTYHTAASSPNPRRAAEPEPVHTVLEQYLSRSASNTHRRSRTASVSTSSSPPTGVSQYEDPEGRAPPLHELRRAAKHARKAAAAAYAAYAAAAAAADAEATEPDDADAFPRAHRASPASTASHPRRSHTEPILERTRPNTPEQAHSAPPLGKSRSLPARASATLAYAVCRGCRQPAPAPPLPPPLFEHRAACCGRCYQPLPPSMTPSASVQSTPRRAPGSVGAASSPRKAPSSGSRRAPTPTDVESDAGGLEEQDEDPFRMFGFSSALPRPSFVLDPAHDPRSPMRGSTTLPSQ